MSDTRNEISVSGTIREGQFEGWYLYALSGLTPQRGVSEQNLFITGFFYVEHKLFCFDHADYPHENTIYQDAINGRSFDVSNISKSDPNKTPSIAPRASWKADTTSIKSNRFDDKLHINYILEKIHPATTAPDTDKYFTPDYAVGSFKLNHANRNLIAGIKAYQGYLRPENHPSNIGNGLMYAEQLSKQDYPKSSTDDQLKAFLAKNSREFVLRVCENAGNARP